MTLIRQRYLSREGAGKGARWEGADRKRARRDMRSHRLKSAYTWNFKQEYACTVVASGNYNQSIQFCITRIPQKITVEQSTHSAQRSLVKSKLKMGRLFKLADFYIQEFSLSFQNSPIMK